MEVVGNELRGAPISVDVILEGVPPVPVRDAAIWAFQFSMTAHLGYVYDSTR